MARGLSPELANNGFSLVTRAMNLLEEIRMGINQLVRVHTDRARNSIAQGAMPFQYTIGTGGIANRNSMSSPNVLDANPERRGLTLTNISAAGGPNITLGLGHSSPAPNIGLTLPPGASWDGLLGNMLWTGSVSAVATANGAVLAGVEA